MLYQNKLCFYTAPSTKMRLTPDNFPIVMDDELRALWRRHRDTDVRRLILEVHRAREVARRCHRDATNAGHGFRLSKHDVAEIEVKKIIDRLFNEMVRLGFIGGIAVEASILF